MKQTAIFLFFCLTSIVLIGQELSFNELYFDPAPGLAGDANRDGVRNFKHDEFIELVNNTTQSIDINGYQIFDKWSLDRGFARYTVSQSTIIPPEGHFVIFGGGDLTNIKAQLPNAVFAKAYLSLSINDVITIKRNDVFIADFKHSDYALDSEMDQSVTYVKSNGAIRHHYSVNHKLFSPGEEATYNYNNTNFIQNLKVTEINLDHNNTNSNGDCENNTNDEFLELVNKNSTAFDISGYEFYGFNAHQNNTPFHVVPDGTILKGGQSYVLFGGGLPNFANKDNFNGAVVQVASSGSLNFRNKTDILFIKDANGNSAYTYDLSRTKQYLNINQSVTRASNKSAWYKHTDYNGIIASPGFQQTNHPPTSRAAVQESDTISDLNELEIEKLSINLYPNPVKNGILHVKPNTGEISTIEIKDPNSRTVIKASRTESINVSSLKRGIYFIKVFVKNKGSVVSKFVVE